MTTITLNLTSIGKKMHKMVEQAIEIIRSHAHNPIPQYKLGYSQDEGDTPDDFATQGDLEAQEMYRETITTDPELEGVGIIGEEGLNIPCTLSDCNAYFTIDPLDGTKAYERKQSFGVGTMIALVVDEKVVAAFIGDINTGEIFSWTEGGKATRERFGRTTVLEPKLTPLKKQYVVFRDAPHKLAPVFSHLSGDGYPNPLFKEIEVSSGGGGLMMARAWKGEIGVIALKGNRYETPWDHTPADGISRALGFVFLRYELGTGDFVEEEPVLYTKVTHRPGIIMLIHRHHLPELRAWMEDYKKTR